jgi:phage FluMu protein Com
MEELITKNVERGGAYLSVPCSKCGEPMPIVEDPAQGANFVDGPGHSRLECPKCHHVDQYATAEARHVAAEPKA